MQYGSNNENSCNNNNSNSINDYSHTVNYNQHCAVNGVFFVISRSLVCNSPLLKDISFNAKCLLVWCE